MLETDLDIALSQGKTIDAREFAEQLILRELCTIQSGLPARCPRRPQRDGILIHVFLKSASYDESL